MGAQNGDATDENGEGDAPAGENADPPVTAASEVPEGTGEAAVLAGETAPSDPPGEGEVVDPAVTAAADAPEGDDLGDDQWHAIFIVEGVTTTDGREFAPGSMSSRPLPLPLEANAHGGPLGGTMRTLVRDPELAQQLVEGGFISLADGAQLLVATGDYVGNDIGAELRRAVNAQELRFVSAQYEIISAEEVYDLDGWGGSYRVTQGNIMGGAAVPFPAFPQCVICPMSMSLYDAATQGFDATATEPISMAPSPVAISASGGPAIPSISWFENPRFGPNDREDSRLVEDPDFPGKFYCPLTITADGRLFAHAAAWHREHVGMAGRKVTPPRSNTNYAYFCTGTVLVAHDDGSDDIIRCGVLTMNTGHAAVSGPSASAAAAKRHYDDTGAQVADIEMGEDAHGIWIAGALHPNVADDDVRALRAGGVSGDWRPQGAGSEMVALLAVNVPGFPLPRPQRSYRVDNEEERDLALVAAGFVPPRDPVMDLVHKEVTAQLEARLGPLMEQLTPMLLERLDSRLG